MTDIETNLLNYVRRPEYKPVKPRVIAKKMGLDDEGTRQLKRALKRLVKQGQLVYGANHLVTSAVVTDAASAESDSTTGITIKRRAAVGADRLAGVFRRTERGFGFVRPEGTSPAADRTTDVYITAKDSLDAANGDKVLVRLRKKRDHRRPNPEGEILEILERDTHQFVGTYFERGGTAYVQVDGKVFAQPIAVGDPGAKNAQVDDKIVVEMIRFPSQTHDGEAVITEVLGARGTPGIDTLSIIREYGLPEEFAEDTLEESRKQADHFDETNLAGRRDLTQSTIITIDPIDARDFDDAISLVRTDKGHWLLGVHIADVSHFVPPRSALEREAYNRATSTYLPDRVIPMLPEVISNGLASLQPDRVRYTKTAFIEFSAEGIPLHTEMCSAAIKSCRRFTYEEVDEYLADRDAWREKLTPQVHTLLAHMHELAMVLRARRFARGALELTMNEVKIDLDKQGRVSGAHRVVNTESHQIIEEFMLSANEAVARWLAEKQLFFLRRVHQAPDPRKLKLLTEFVKELGYEVESLESRFELQRLLAAVKGQPEQHAVNYALLRSLQRAVYAPEDEGHYALASECYCHFTSPIRRYPDLTIHRLVETVLLGNKPRNDFAELVVQGVHCSDRERRAEAAERELTKVKLLNYLSERIGETLEGVITGVEEFGMFVQGTEMPAEGLVHISSLQDDFYRFDRRSHTLVGHRAGNQFRLGDLVKVQIAHVDVDRRELDFRLVQREAGRADRGKVVIPADRGKRKTKDRDVKTARGKSAGKSKPTKKTKRGKGR
jgi:ribonuclease R